MNLLLKDIIKTTHRYNFHTHTQFCDGKDTMEAISASASRQGFLHLGFTPHSPVCCQSPCNMHKDSVQPYLDEASRLKEMHEPDMRVYTSMEIDYLGCDFGPHIDYFQKLPLDYRLASVHFVPNQNGVLIDCDGSYKRFIANLREGFNGDLRYVVEKYFEQVLTMIETGGFDMLGHLDKIAQNASKADPGIEDCGWYEALIDDVISQTRYKGLIIEINTKYLNEKDRFFPALRWWDKLEGYDAVAVNSDAHYAEKITAGREEAFAKLKNSCKN